MRRKFDLSVLALLPLALVGLSYVVIGPTAEVLGYSISVEPLLFTFGSLFFAALTYEEIRQERVLTIASGPISLERSPGLYWIVVASHASAAAIAFMVVLVQALR